MKSATVERASAAAPKSSGSRAMPVATGRALLRPSGCKPDDRQRGQHRERATGHSGNVHRVGTVDARNAFDEREQGHGNGRAEKRDRCARHPGVLDNQQQPDCEERCRDAEVDGREQRPGGQPCADRGNRSNHEPDCCSTTQRHYCGGTRTQPTDDSGQHQQPGREHEPSQQHQRFTGRELREWRERARALPAGEQPRGSRECSDRTSHCGDGGALERHGGGDEHADDPPRRRGEEERLRTRRRVACALREHEKRRRPEREYTCDRSPEHEALLG